MTNQPKSEPFDLDRFVSAQRPVYEAVLAELRQGRKQTHWIWFVFPQVDGLGSSSTARHYAIKSRAEAAAYLAHPVLGVRLLECTETVLAHSRRSAHDIFGSPDDLKFCSSMTLFERAGGSPGFGRALDQFFGGERDSKTLAIFNNWPT
jgi:uncharacterized protein (DUF1810 family)